MKNPIKCPFCKHEISTKFGEPGGCPYCDKFIHPEHYGLPQEMYGKDMNRPYWSKTHPEYPNKNPRSRESYIFSTHCKRCGKAIASSRWAIMSPLGQICHDCITPKEREEILEYQAGAILKKARKNPTGSSLYESFHGMPPKTKRVIHFTPPKGTLLSIGTVSRIDYVPGKNSKHKNVNFFHRTGDTGSKQLESNWILATNSKGTEFYLIKDKKSKYPLFSGRGIIG